MESTGRKRTEAVDVVLPCRDLTATIDFFVNELGFRLDLIFPADAPRVASVSGFGARIRFEKDGAGDPGTLRLMSSDPDMLARSGAMLIAPNGTRVEVVPAESPLVLPPLDAALVVQQSGVNGGWGEGRAGMQYRDLVPGRQGGRFIASHIRIPTGGPVPDYVHHHHVRFQMIYCYRGWVKVVYEDQGPPFVMRAGDCVLQPPHIRHRVLECSDAFEVVEIGCPAEHETLVDHELDLPNPLVRPDREFGGQQFKFHRAAGAAWRPARIEAFESRDTGIAGATGGLASVEVIRPLGESGSPVILHNGEFLFHFVLDGTIRLAVDRHGERDLGAGDSFVIPAGMRFEISQPSADLELLEVALPANIRTTPVGARD